ncbi:uncharacterized protein LOC132298832 [Cornus florida]|uniref:uncharacterized protein LOC132298832 n=1 Tax=Cornus florida TaxID=4283 RepID=UPI00289CF0DB|nr:uncharacterized protein LOC132298832 [Cornus florida]
MPTMTNHEDDLDLLLSLQDRVLETPPASPSTFHSQSPGYHSDDGLPKRSGHTDMSVFRNAVEDCLDYEPQNVKKDTKSNILKNSHDAGVEKFSGLRIRNQVVSSTELSNRFSDIRFVRVPAIKNLLVGDTLSGCWATVGVLTEKGNPKNSSTGKKFCIWKIGCLDEKTISVFLFGDAYQKNCKEEAGTVFALFNCGVRKDTSGSGFTLSAYSAGQILKIGTSLDYGVCKGKKKDGMACTLAINKHRGTYCTYHKSKASQKYSVSRTELKGGNLRTAFRDPLKSEGIYCVDPLADRTNLKKSMQPVKLLSVEGLKKALSNADKVTTNIHSQGIRFLAEVTGIMGSKTKSKIHAMPKPQSVEKRSLSTAKLDSSAARSQQPNAKRTKTEQQAKPSAEKTKQVREKMIELEFVSSDEEI